MNAISWQPYEEMAFITPRFEAAAQELDLDMDAWSACLESERPDDVLEAARTQMEEAGVNSTPSVFLNGETVASSTGAVFDAIESALEEE